MYKHTKRIQKGWMRRVQTPALTAQASAHGASMLVVLVAKRKLVGGKVLVRQRNLADGAEFACVVQVLVLQSQKVPNEASVKLHCSQHRHEAVVEPHVEEANGNADCPGQTADDVVHNGKVVEPNRVQQLLAQKRVVCLLGQQTKVHLHIPQARIDCVDGCGDGPQHDVGRERRLEVVLFLLGGQRREEDDAEHARVLARIHQMRERLARVAVTAETLGKAEPGGQRRHDGPHTVCHALAHRHPRLKVVAASAEEELQVQQEQRQTHQLVGQPKVLKLDLIKRRCADPPQHSEQPLAGLEGEDVNREKEKASEDRQQRNGTHELRHVDMLAEDVDEHKGAPQYSHKPANLHQVFVVDAFPDVQAHDEDVVDAVLLPVVDVNAEQGY
eukprot:m.156743 g.156743  ORF g.156743 m.156743 type:complete len:386 (+) comp16996_c0_seq2:19-1176(+)